MFHPAQPSRAETPASFTPQVAARKAGLSCLALIYCKILFHLKKKKNDRESSQRAKLLRTHFEPAPCRSNSRRNSGQAVFSYVKGPRESEGAKLN